MSQQGGRATGHEDDWWGQLYDDSTEDTGPAPATESLDDRFASAAGAVRSAGGATGVGASASAGADAEDDVGAGAPDRGGAGDSAGRWDAAVARDPAGGPDDEAASGAARAVPAPRGEGQPGPGARTDWWSSPQDGDARPEVTPAAPQPRGRFAAGADAKSDTRSDAASAGGWDGGVADEADVDQGAAADPDDSVWHEVRGDLGWGVAPVTGSDVERHAGSGPRRDAGGRGAEPGDTERSDGVEVGVGAAAADAAPGARPPQRHRAPWEPPADTPPEPTNFPPGPLPPGFAERAPHGPVTSTTGDGMPTETSSASAIAEPPAEPSVPVPPAAPAASTPSAISATTPPRPSSAPLVPPPAPVTPPAPAHAPPPPNAPTASAHGSAVAPFAPPTPERAPILERAPASGRALDSGHDHLPTVVALPALPALPAHPPLPILKAYVGSGPPTYDAEPTALPPADPDELDDLVADTVLDGARYGTLALRAASVRGDSARYRGEPRRDSLLTARFGSGEHALILVAMATGARATPGAHRAAAEACRWIGRAVGRSHVRLAEDIRAARRGDLKSGLHRLTDRSLGRLRASAAEQGLEPDEYAATLRCLLLPADPDCRTRVFFGVGAGGLFRLRGGVWRDIEPRVGEVVGEPVVGFGSLPAETPEGDRLTMDLGIPTPANPYDPDPEPPREPFRFRASVARPGDTLLMCTGGLAEPLRGEPDLSAHLTERWSGPTPPGLAAFLADTQVRVKGYADDRTAAAVWEA
ncbi:protein phosphatase 2C domain-containing protein [Streptomyces sp. NPDC050263]|uniref:protein phosphatase 2C domain-containing protein n=1 Tax=Streptomyces sp. NPDC050263 TaxID=3155037 RepID=UPI0034402AB1